MHIYCINCKNVFVGARTRASDPNTFQPPPFGQGTGPIFWDDVRCTGSEQRLDECPHLTTLQGSEDCIHDEDVGITCQPLPATTQPPTTTSKLHNMGVMEYGFGFNIVFGDVCLMQEVVHAMFWL